MMCVALMPRMSRVEYAGAIYHVTMRMVAQLGERVERSLSIKVILVLKSPKINSPAKFNIESEDDADLRR